MKSRRERIDYNAEDPEETARWEKDKQADDTKDKREADRDR